MTDVRRRRKLALIALPLGVFATIPMIVRGWSVIEQGLPVWAGMILLAMSVIAALGFIALAVAYYRVRWDQRNG